MILLPVEEDPESKQTWLEKAISKAKAAAKLESKEEVASRILEHTEQVRACSENLFRGFAKQLCCELMEEFNAEVSQSPALDNTPGSISTLDNALGLVSHVVLWALAFQNLEEGFLSQLDAAEMMKVTCPIQYGVVLYASPCNGQVPGAKIMPGLLFGWHFMRYSQLKKSLVPSANVSVYGPGDDSDRGC